MNPAPGSVLRALSSEPDQQHQIRAYEMNETIALHEIVDNPAVSSGLIAYGIGKKYKKRQVVKDVSLQCSGARLSDCSAPMARARRQASI